MERHGSDDWFDEPSPAEDSWNARVERLAREQASGEDWLREPTRAGADDAGIRFSPRVVIVAALIVCFFVGILAAVGVFSGSRRPAALATTRTPHVVTAKPVRTTTKPTLAVPTAPMRPGDTGASVAKLQRALTKAGYSPGKADGSYGNATTQAVKEFQAAHGLTADGVAGPKTLTALENTVQSG